MTMTAFPLTLPLNMAAPRRMAVEPSYDWTGTGCILPVLVIELADYTEIKAVTDWLPAQPFPDAPAPYPIAASKTPILDAAEALAETLAQDYPDPARRMAIATMLLASVALDCDVPPDDATDQLRATMDTLAALRADVDLLDLADDDAEGEFAA